MSNMICGRGWLAIRIDFWWVHPDTVDAPDPADRWEPVPVRDRDHAIWLLDNYRDGVQAMRNLLADGGLGSSRYSDQQIIDQIAQKLADRYLLLFSRGAPHPALANIVATAAPQSSLLPPFVPPARQKMPAAAGAIAQPTRQVAAQVIEVDFDSIDQGAQTDTLRMAAAAGVPFCAVCEDLARRGTPADSSREAA